MSGAVLILSTGRSRKPVDLAGYIDAALEERAQLDAIAWIKALREAAIDGMPMRRRFTYRGDSLWWFTEIYLHKQQVVLSLFRTIAALEALLASEMPRSIELERFDRITGVVAPQIAAGHGVSVTGSVRPPVTSRVRLAAMHTRARWLHLAARASRGRTRVPPSRPDRPTVAAFVHRAFWRHASPTLHGAVSSPEAHLHADGSAEAYIGPVLEALERRLPGRDLAYVSLGPAENFSARRWWHPLRSDAAGTASSIESYAPLESLSGSLGLWAQRRENLRALSNSASLREAAVIGNCDCWHVIREELAGVALLQWPWSARAMDEAGAALDALKPAVAVTYAEAGGWGRALMLECRRRGVASAGLQHGFIYRHWLNYLHETDEMSPDPAQPSDAGFPRPQRTLLFDEYARHHLVSAGRFPAGSLAVTGSPRLDALVAADRALDAARVEAAQSSAAATDATMVLVVTKFREAKAVLPALLDAAGAMPDIRLAIKTHPAETPDIYAELVAGRAGVKVLPANAELAPLLRASRAIVTVNSTVALDAAVLNIPALVIGLPNNLSPFVAAGVLAGAEPAGIAAALRRILYDRDFRLQLEHSREAFLSRFSICSDGRAADRSADAVLGLAQRRV